MKVFNFHLMPYRHADLDAIEKNGSAWVTFSNRHYDPQKGADLYHEYPTRWSSPTGSLRWRRLNEHHQTAYGMMPIPGVLRALGGQARQACDPGCALPLLNNPMVAEEYAMLDNLPAGASSPALCAALAEYHAMGINPVQSQERCRGARSDRARLTEPGPFAYGKHYQFNYINRGRGPTDAASADLIPAGSSSTIRWAAAMRYTYCQRWSIAAEARFFQMYRDEAEKAGYQASPDQLAWSNTIYVAETDEKACAKRPHLEALVNRP
jgi:hypothetical protein